MMRMQINKVSFGLLLAFLCVSAQNNATKEVFRHLNHSVQFTIQRTLTYPIEEVVWAFRSEGKTVKVAEIKNDQMVTYVEQFADRIQTLNNGATLIIEQLRATDSGTYMAYITVTTKQTYEQSFELFVYEPFWTPSIVVKKEKNTNNWCNMTVHCSIPKNLPLVFYTWMYRHGSSAYQLYNNTAAKVQISLQPESWDMEVMCIVNTTADWKNVTLYVQPICSLGGKGCAIYLRLTLAATYMVLSIWFICLSQRYK